MGLLPLLCVIVCMYQAQVIALERRQRHNYVIMLLILELHRQQLDAHWHVLLYLVLVFMVRRRHLKMHRTRLIIGRRGRIRGSKNLGCFRLRPVAFSASYFGQA